MKRFRLSLLGLAALLLLGGCGGFGDYAALIKGNRLHRRGDYQGAAAAYLSVEKAAFRPILAYDLGNAYARLGEEGAAAELYAEARLGGGGRLKAWSWYNEGLALYETGLYEEAYRAFREALALDPRDGDARRNLELAYRDWKKRSLAPPESFAPASRREGGRDEEELSLLRRLETGRWRPGSKESALPDPGDY